MGLSSLQLEAFLAVSQSLNFTKAAKSLHITQSALSQRVLNLESELGVSLFIRHKSGLKLTETAQNLVRYCQFKNQREDEFISDLKEKDSSKLSGFLRVAGFSSVTRSILLPGLAPLLSKNDSIKLQLLTRENYELWDLLKRNEVDYLILNEKMERQEVESVFLGYEDYVLLKSKSYQGKDIYLDHDEADDVTHRYLAKYPNALKKAHRQYLDDDYGILDALKLGLGVGILPMHLVKSEKSLVAIDPKHVLRMPVSLYFYRQPYYTKLHTHFVEAVLTSFQKTLKQN